MFDFLSSALCYHYRPPEVTKSVYFVTSSEFLLFNVLVVGSISLNLHAQQPRALCRQNREEGSVTSISCLNLIFSAALLGLLVYNKVGCCIRSISILVMRSSTGVPVVLHSAGTARRHMVDWWRSHRCETWFAVTAGVHSCS